MKDKIYAKLSEIIDPEVGFDIVSLGLIYGVEVVEGRAVVTMTLSTKSCPLHELILGWVREAALSVEGVGECEIDLVWEPAWDISMASDEVKAKLG
ncbi:metal-sulfur cluster assembly factor [Campylobacter sp. 19-13652]|uniref:metal-sulfur cluster assembly factor n=1 Tax=Campylobacter sp. 19-13652 TaxID=2840180 RepID=UPI001C785469|nr:metal-sulfur cluster assembly factor [Campylobacter sp. 19-13652]BCX79543.1 DNA methyltransferase [Campylobacter sp. 19-13652]